MAKKLIYDTETTGLPDWKNPSEAEHQPHLVELAMALVDVGDDGSVQILETCAALVCPAGWVIPDDVIALHGITNEMATAEGCPEGIAFAQLLAMCDKADERIAFNKTFDDRIVRIGLKRYYDDATADAFKAAPSFCAMQAARKIMGGKAPTLAEAYKHFTGLDHTDAHRALPDVLATVQVYAGVLKAQAEAAAGLAVVA